MPMRLRPTAEFAFVVSGLSVAGTGWAADLLGLVAAGGEPGHGTGDLFFRMNMLFFAMGLAGIGVGFQHHARFLRDPVFALRYLAGYVILADGFIHAYAFNDHLGEPIQAAFFAVVTPLQIVVGLALPYGPRKWIPASLAMTAGLIAAYVATRTVEVWPVSEIEEVEILGLLSKALELLAVLLLVQLLREERKAARKRAPRSPEAATHP
jgi:hypothetical protein